MQEWNEQKKVERTFVRYSVSNQKMVSSQSNKVAVSKIDSWQLSYTFQSLSFIEGKSLFYMDVPKTYPNSQCFKGIQKQCHVLYIKWLLFSDPRVDVPRLPRWSAGGRCVGECQWYTGHSDDTWGDSAADQECVRWKCHTAGTERRPCGAQHQGVLPWRSCENELSGIQNGKART